jgi:hypothetical protein
MLAKVPLLSRQSQYLVTFMMILKKITGKVELFVMPENDLFTGRLKVRCKPYVVQVSSCTVKMSIG